jgi:hypothetical protein
MTTAALRTAITGAPPYSYAELMDVIHRCIDETEIGALEDIARTWPNEKQRAELDVEIRAKQKAFGSPGLL